MTDNPLAPFEAAARLYCQKVGIDPDEKIPVQNRRLVGVNSFVYRWQLAAEELMDFSMKLTSLREAAQPKPVKQ